MIIQLDASKPFNLDYTLCCGQTFRWNKQGSWWLGIVGNKALKVRQVNDKLEFENESISFFERYFRLDDNLPAIYSEISKDLYMKKAIRAFHGLRILRQDPWECLISYICATYKSIAAIKNMLLKLSMKLGDKIAFDDLEFYSFPTPQTLARASIKELQECGLGFRAKYVSQTAKTIYKNGFDFELLKKIPYEEARRKLLAFSGVGLKVADCVLLFSLEKLEAFPVDVWMKRVLVRHYTKLFPSQMVDKIQPQESLSNPEYRKLSICAREYFGAYAGYAQEYLYHYERSQR
jgi:N-glycosylase/DNA lyase